MDKTVSDEVRKCSSVASEMSDKIFEALKDESGSVDGSKCLYTAAIIFQIFAKDLMQADICQPREIRTMLADYLQSFERTYAEELNG